MKRMYGSPQRLTPSVARSTGIPGKTKAEKKREKRLERRELSRARHAEQVRAWIPSLEVEKVHRTINNDILAVFKPRESRSLARLEKSAHDYGQRISQLLATECFSWDDASQRKLESLSITLRSILAELEAVDHPQLWPSLRLVYDTLYTASLHIKGELFRTSQGYVDINFYQTKKSAKPLEGYIFQDLPEKSQLLNQQHHMDKVILGGVSFPSMLVTLSSMVHRALHNVIDQQEAEETYFLMRESLPLTEGEEQALLMQDLEEQLMEIHQETLQRLDNIGIHLRTLHAQIHMAITHGAEFDQIAPDRQRELYTMRHLDSTSEIFRDSYVLRCITGLLETIPLLLDNLKDFHVRADCMRLTGLLEEFKVQWMILTTEDKIALSKAAPALSPLITLAKEIFALEPLEYHVRTPEMIEGSSPEWQAYTKRAKYLRAHVENVLGGIKSHGYTALMEPLLALHELLTKDDFLDSSVKSL